MKANTAKDIEDLSTVSYIYPDSQYVTYPNYPYFPVNQLQSSNTIIYNEPRVVPNIYSIPPRVVPNIYSTPPRVIPNIYSNPTRVVPNIYSSPTAYYSYYPSTLSTLVKPPSTYYSSSDFDSSNPLYYRENLNRFPDVIDEIRDLKNDVFGNPNYNMNNYYKLESFLPSNREKGHIKANLNIEKLKYFQKHKDNIYDIDKKNIQGNNIKGRNISIRNEHNNNNYIDNRIQRNVIKEKGIPINSVKTCWGKKS